MKRYFLVPILLLIFMANAFADTCIDWGKVMTKFDIDNISKSKKAVLLQPFENFTHITADDWLSTGIPYMIGEYLNNVVTDVNGIANPIAKYDPAAANPAYTLTGMYQHTSGKLRIFPKLMQGTEVIKQFQIDLPYPQNKQFFDSLGDVALGILQVVSPRYDRDKFNLIKTETYSVPAYENYIRGILSYSNFYVNQMEIAKTWFEESKKADLYYARAYLGLVNVYTFLAMYNKQNRKAFEGYFEKAANEIDLMHKFAQRLPPQDIPRKYTIKMKERPLPLTNRFLIGQGSFIAGLDAAGQKNYALAAQKFEETLVQTPEDAITWYHLGQMREHLGDSAKANEAYAKAKEINKCLN